MSEGEPIKLSKQQEQFCQVWVLCGNASQAYREAYSTKNSTNKTVWECASRLAANPKVAARCEQIRAEIRKRHDEVQDVVIAELLNIATADPRDYMEWGPDGVKLKDSKHLTRQQASAVASASESVSQFGMSLKLNMNSKNAALSQLARILGMNKDTLAVTQPGSKTDAEKAQLARDKLRAINGGKN